MQYYVKFVATIIAQQKKSERQIIQIVLGDPQDIINQTQGMNPSDMLKLALTAPVEAHIGQKICLEGLLALDTHPPTLKN